MLSLIVIPAVLLGSQVKAVASPGPFSLSLFTRQAPPGIPLSSIPEQCQSACKDMLDVGTTCSGSTGIEGCLCNQAIGDAFVKCGNCVINLPQVPASLKDQEQQALDSITATCQSAGHPFSKPLKIDGSSSGSTGSSSASGSSTSGSPSSSSGGSGSSGSGSIGSSSGSGALSVSPSGIFAVLSIVGGLLAVEI